MKSNSITKGYTLVANQPLVFPASDGRTQFFVVNTSTDDVQIAFGEVGKDVPALAYIPLIGDNGHIDLQPQPRKRITLLSSSGGTVVVATDDHTTLAKIQPMINVHPMSANIEASTQTTLSIEVDNEDGMNFTWQTRVEGEDWINRASETAKTYTFALGVGTNRGVRCLVWNKTLAIGSATTVTSEAAHMTVGKVPYPPIPQPAIRGKAYKLGNYHGEDADYVYVKGIGFPKVGDIHRVTFYDATERNLGTDVAAVDAARFPVNTVFRSKDGLDTITVATAPIFDGHTGSVDGTVSSTFSISLPDMHAIRTKFAFPNEWYVDWT